MSTRPVETFPPSSGWVERHAKPKLPMTSVELDVYFEQMKSDVDRLVKGWSGVSAQEMHDRLARVVDR